VDLDFSPLRKPRASRIEQPPRDLMVIDSLEVAELSDFSPVCTVVIDGSDDASENPTAANTHIRLRMTVAEEWIARR
jgi:hypothetical protein